MNVPQITADTLRRFWQRVNFSGPVMYPEMSRCWEWTGTRRTGGYGIFYLLKHERKSRARIGAHRFALFLSGRLDPEKHACHKCDNPSCVRPHHLYSGTDLQNSADRWRRETLLRGFAKDLVFGVPEDEIRGRCRITDGEMKTIRKMAKWHINLHFGSLLEDDYTPLATSGLLFSAPDTRSSTPKPAIDVGRLLSCLSSREQDVIRGRFCFESRDPMTLAALGKRFGVTKERIRQLEARALTKLRASFNELEC